MNLMAKITGLSIIVLFTVTCGIMMYQCKNLDTMTYIGNFQ